MADSNSKFSPDSDAEAEESGEADSNADSGSADDADATTKGDSAPEADADNDSDSSFDDDDTYRDANDAGGDSDSGLDVEADNSSDTETDPSTDNDPDSSSDPDTDEEDDSDSTSDGDADSDAGDDADLDSESESEVDDDSDDSGDDLDADTELAEDEDADVDSHADSDEGSVSEESRQNTDEEESFSATTAVGATAQGCPLSRGDLTVYTLEAADEAPIEGARVSIDGPSGPQDATTDIDGKASFTQLEPGSYSIEAWRDLDSTDDPETADVEVEGGGEASADVHFGLKSFRIRFFDPAERYIANAPYQVPSLGVRDKNADGQGWAEIKVKDLPDACVVEWGYSGDDPPQYVFKLDLKVAELDSMSPDQQARQRLLHLGYPPDSSLSECLKEFQGDYSLKVTGILTSETKAKIWEIHESCELKAFDESGNASPKPAAT